MKLIWWMLIAVVLMVVALPALEGLGKIGERRRAQTNPTVLDPLTTPMTPGSADAASEQTDAVQASGSMYRWRDAGGTLHIESEPPRDGTAFETINYETRTQSSSDIVESADDASASGLRQPRNEPLKPFGVYTPEGMKQLLERVDDTARQLEARDKLMEDLSDQL